MRLIRKGGAPIIVGGFYRSGTTLLRRFLDAHSKIHCPPEIKFFRDFYGNYFDDDLSHIRYFTTLRTIGLDEETLLDIHGQAFIRSHEAAMRSFGKARWADKNPENLLYLDRWFALLKGKMVFLFVVRDPLDTLASLLEVGFPKTIPAAFDEKIDLLITYIERGISFWQSHPECTLLVKYEELVTSPQSELTRLFEFVGEKFEARVLTEFRSSDRGRGIEDPKILLEGNVHTRSIGRGRIDLQPEQAERVASRCGPIFEKIGYRTAAL